MIRSLLYLQGTSLWNGVRQRLRRLRQPRYLIATLLGAAYFYFFFFRHVLGRNARAPAMSLAPGELGLMVGLGVGGTIVVGRIAYAWIFSSQRAAVAFTEAEVAFLFPAPVTRRALLHFKLLKSQLRLLFSALLTAVLSQRLSPLGGSVWSHAVGWWILFSTIELHGIAASFTRERLLGLGFRPAWRRVVFGSALVALVLAAGWWLRRTAPAPTPADLANAAAIVRYLQTVLATPPLPWVLAPLRWIMGPLLAPDGAAFLRALGPALLLLALHYLWVIRSEVSFEEASIELARRRAEIRAARRTGRRGSQRRTARRREPFVLGSRGPAPVAFLWKNLIAAGPWFYPRTWLLFSAAVLAATLWLAADPAHRPWLHIVQAVGLPLACWVLIVGPMLMRREVRLMMERLDVLKALPLHGWQVVLGELLSPIVLITAVEWLILAVLSVTVGTLTRELTYTLFISGAGAVGVGLLVPPVVGLMAAIPFAATLYFPTWMSGVGQVGGGMEVMGQRLIFAGGYLLVLIVALLPATLAATVCGLPVYWVVGTLPGALFTGALAAGAVLGGELAAVVWWLGRRYERFDLSTEIPQA